jgi:integrase
VAGDARPRDRPGDGAGRRAGAAAGATHALGGAALRFDPSTDPDVAAAGRARRDRLEYELAVGSRSSVAPNERLSPHSLRSTYTSHLIVGLELDAATTSKLAGHANPNVTMRVYADDFRKSSERDAAVLKRAAERGFGS